MKRLNLLFAFVALVCLVLANPVQAQDPVTVQVGNGTFQNETMPIFNWWKSSYTGNEVIYLRDELGMKKGDEIVALSYQCISGSAYGGNFNVRIINTNLNTLPTQQESYNDVSVIQVGYNDKVYCNATMGSYSTGDWITFTFDEPFVYEGENIIIDIRNTAPAESQGWCYFACTQDRNIARRNMVWRNGNSENVEADGFHDGYTPFGVYDTGIYEYKDDEDHTSFYPNTRFTYNPAPAYPKAEDGEYIFYQHSHIINVGASTKLPIELFNRSDIAALEFDIEVPEEVLILSNGTKGIERGENATMHLSDADEGIMHVDINFKNVLSTGKGPFSQLGLHATKNGVYSLKLLNPVITTTDGTKYSIDDSELQFVATSRPGDMNSDNAIDGTDLNAIINLILGK